MLACVDSLDCPLVVQAVGEGNKDGIDVGVRQQLVVGALDLWNAVLFGKGFSLCAVARSDGLYDDFGVRFGRDNEGQGSGGEASQRRGSAQRTGTRQP